MLCDVDAVALGCKLKGIDSVLVTGGAGFIGSHLVEGLLVRDYSVVVLDNFQSGRIENLKECFKHDGFRLVKGDVRDSVVVRDVVGDVDAVVHLAALIDVEESVNYPVETHDVNVTGTLNVLEVAVKKGIKKFAYASSTAVYGEGSSLPLGEDCCPKPLSPYAASKASAEWYCEAFHQSYKLPTFVLRYFNVYGPRQENNPYSGVIARFLNNALGGKPLLVFGDGEQSRDFVYVDDVVEATILALESGNLVNRTINVCTGYPVTINELVQIVGEVTGKNLQVVHSEQRKGDIRANYGDPTRAQETIGFKAKISLRQGLKSFLKSLISRTN